MKFPTTTEEFLKTIAHGKEPTSEDREYAEAPGKLSELNGQGTKRDVKKSNIISAIRMYYKLHRKIV